jgi:enamine deaminase RidA (YjgF/YER057c/UK114 family)
MTAATIKLFSPNSVHKPMGYSHAAEISGGRLVCIAGQVAQDASGALVGKDDFRAQVQQVFTNLKVVVEATGGTFANIIKLNYFCCERVSPNDLPIVREVRDQFVDTRSPPVSTFVFVSRLVRAEWLIEIEALAVLPSDGTRP